MSEDFRAQVEKAMARLAADREAYEAGIENAVWLCRRAGIALDMADIVVVADRLLFEIKTRSRRKTDCDKTVENLLQAIADRIRTAGPHLRLLLADLDQAPKQ